ncbi:hypothetical protein N9V90_01380, partial [Endozoicomonas sp.]|nr:hypothetical protein [Endozoicomonas sp.]
KNTDKKLTAANICRELNIIDTEQYKFIEGSGFRYNKTVFTNLYERDCFKKTTGDEKTNGKKTNYWAFNSQKYFTSKSKAKGHQSTGDKEPLQSVPASTAIQPESSLSTLGKYVSSSVNLLTDEGTAIALSTEGQSIPFDTRGHQRQVSATVEKAPSDKSDTITGTTKKMVAPCNLVYRDINLNTWVSTDIHTHTDEDAVSRNQIAPVDSAAQLGELSVDDTLFFGETMPDLFEDVSIGLQPE